MVHRPGVLSQIVDATIAFQQVRHSEDSPLVASRQDAHGAVVATDLESVLTRLVRLAADEDDLSGLFLCPKSYGQRRPCQFLDEIVHHLGSPASSMGRVRQYDLCRWLASLDK